jgi:hypothetical protein
LIVTSLVMATYGIAIFIGFLLSIYHHDLYIVYQSSMICLYPNFEIAVVITAQKHSIHRNSFG